MSYEEDEINGILRELELKEIIKEICLEGNAKNIKKEYQHLIEKDGKVQ